MLRVIVIVLLLASACSVQTGSTGPTGTVPASSIPAGTTEALVESPATSTTESPEGSTATILIGPARYDLTAICAAGGAGEVEVSVSGSDVNGLRVVGYIRAFLGAPYVSLQVGEGDAAVLFEPRLEGVLPFELTGRGVEFPEVDFVTELDLDTGEFVPAGIGSVDVACRTYVRELPPVPFG